MKLIVGFALVLAGCAVNQTATVDRPLWTSRADMQVILGDKQFEGMASTKADPNTPITFISPVNIDRVSVTTCAREQICQSGGSCDQNFGITKSWLGTTSQRFTYAYAPAGAEVGGQCPMYIQAFSKANLASWAFIAFRSDETLPAHVVCNGSPMLYSGFTSCQTKASLEQSIKFDAKYGEVKVVAEPSCHMKKLSDNNFEFVPDIGFCRATFGAKVDGKMIYHRLIALGYEGVLVRAQ